MRLLSRFTPESVVFAACAVGVCLFFLAFLFFAWLFKLGLDLLP